MLCLLTKCQAACVTYSLYYFADITELIRTNALANTRAFKQVSIFEKVRGEGKHSKIKDAV